MAIAFKRLIACRLQLDSAQAVTILNVCYITRGRTSTSLNKRGGHGSPFLFDTSDCNLYIAQKK